MIRYPCPNCKVTLKAPDDKAGTKSICPKCQARTYVPAKGATVEDRAATALGHDAPTKSRASLSATGWLAVGLPLLVFLVGLPLSMHAVNKYDAVRNPGIVSAGHIGFFVCLLALILFLVALQGYVKCCPYCRRLWGRFYMGKVRLDAQTFYKTEAAGKAADGSAGERRVEYRRVGYKDVYECRYCKQQWSTSAVDEYPVAHGKVRKKKKKGKEQEVAPEEEDSE